MAVCVVQSRRMLHTPALASVGKQAVICRATLPTAAAAARSLCKCQCVSVCTCLYVHMPVCVCVCVCVFVNVHVPVCVYACVYQWAQLRRVEKATTVAQTP